MQCSTGSRISLPRAAATSKRSDRTEVVPSASSRVAEVPGLLARVPMPSGSSRPGLPRSSAPCRATQGPSSEGPRDPWRLSRPGRAYQFEGEVLVGAIIAGKVGLPTFSESPCARQADAVAADGRARRKREQRDHLRVDLVRAVAGCSSRRSPRHLSVSRRNPLQRPPAGACKIAACLGDFRGKDTDSVQALAAPARACRGPRRWGVRSPGYHVAAAARYAARAEVT